MSQHEGQKKHNQTAKCVYKRSFSHSFGVYAQRRELIAIEYHSLAMVTQLVLLRFETAKCRFRLRKMPHYRAAGRIINKN
jgi:hypothetical protein